MNNKEDLDDNKDDIPPVGGSWKNLYILVLAVLFIQIILYYFITNIFS